MLGPLELIVIEFPGNHFKGEIMPVLYKLSDKGLIRIIDLVFIRKDERGDIFSYELSEAGSYELGQVDDDIANFFSSLNMDLSNLISEDDIEKVGEALNNNSSAGILLFEHKWSLQFIEAVKNAQGRLVFDYKVPQETVEKVLQVAGVRD